MNFLDLVVVAVAAAAGVLGYRMGFLRRGFSWAGLALGVVLAVALVDDVADALRASPPRTRLLASLAFVFLIATIGQGIGFAIGSGVRQRVGRAGGAALRRGDSVAGAVLGVFGVLALMWLLIPALGELAGVAGRRRARVGRGAHHRPLRAASRPTSRRRSGASSATRRSPRCSTPSPHPTRGDPPDGGIPADAAARVAQSVVKVTGSACDRTQEGTGFAVTRDLVVTNAHVVAGEESTGVETDDGRRLDTQLVAFDPNRDLAVLRVPGLGMPALTRADGSVDQRGAIFGHPGGGPLRESPMRIAEEIVAEGTNIERTAADHSAGVRARRGRRRPAIRARPSSTRPVR